MSIKLLERDIKALLIKHLLEKSIIEKGDTLINEFSIDTHTRRIDLLALRKNTTIGFEIKSEADSLTRISGQIEKYKNYFDKIIIVAAKKHIPHLLQLVEPNIGIWQVEDSSFIVIRKGRSTPVKVKENLLKLISLNFLIKIAQSNNLNVPRYSKDRKSLEALLSKLSTSKIRVELHLYLSEKYKIYSSEFMLNFGNQNNYDSSALALLSPYSENRLLIKTRNQKTFETLRKLTEEYSDEANHIVVKPPSTKLQNPVESLDDSLKIIA